MFTRQLALLLKAGVNLGSALTILARQYINGPFGSVISSIAVDVYRGVRSNVAFARHADAFDAFYVAMLTCGEAHGNLPNVLDELADWLEREAELRRRLFSVMVYPAFVLAVTMGLTWALFRFVLPAFLPTMQSLGAALPLPTRILMLMVELVHSWLFLICTGALIVLLVCKWERLFRSEAAQEFRERIQGQIPVLGTVQQNVELLRISRGLGIMLGSGLFVLEALRLTSTLCGTQRYRRSLLRVKRDLGEGDSLGEAFSGQKACYPSRFAQIVRSGEESGRLSDMLTRLAQMYERDVDIAMDAAMALIEPCIMGFLALIVGFVIVAIFLPLYASISHL